jgi:hypothetical protein
MKKTSRNFESMDLVKDLLVRQGRTFSCVAASTKKQMACERYEVVRSDVALPETRVRSADNGARLCLVRRAFCQRQPPCRCRSGFSPYLLLQSRRFCGQRTPGKFVKVEFQLTDQYIGHA